MVNRIHFLSGLPRSGSTLLAAILRQNPEITAGMMGPVATIFRALEDATAHRVETSVFVTAEQRDALLRGIFDIYYRRNEGIIFDTARMWCARLPVLARLFPESKIIACVREIGWIVDSFERLYRRNGQVPSGIYNWDTGGTVWSRAAALSQSSGVIGFALDALREAVAAEESNRLLLVDYEALCRHPLRELRRIYEFIGLPPFTHDFENVSYEAGEFDRQLGAEGLHTVRGRVEWRPRKTILPPELFARYGADSFWKTPTRMEAA